MSSQKNYHSITNRVYAYCYIWALTGYCLLSISLLCQGCSSNMGSTSRIESPANKQIEFIGAPKLVVKNSSYDFGNIEPGSTNTATFNFTNVGDRPLKITNVKRCCGAVTKLDKEELAPGESGVLTAQYRVGQASSLLRKKIGLVTNDPKNPQAELVITGKVVGEQPDILTRDKYVRSRPIGAE